MRWAALALCAWLTAACSAPAPRAPESAPPPQAPLASPAPTPAQVEVQPAQAERVPSAIVVRPIASPSPPSVPLSAAAGRSGADLRVTLNALLAENAFLTALAVQAAANTRLDELIGVSAMLDDNATSLAEIVGAARGPAAAQALLEANRGQAADFVRYAQGQQTAATVDLELRRAAIAAQLGVGDFATADADNLWRRRTQAELAVADSLIGHDAAEAAQRLVAVDASSDDLARPLAAAIAAQVHDLSPAATEGGDVDVRLQLTQALEQHVYLTGAAIEAAADGRSADGQTLEAAVGQAADDLAHQLGSVYPGEVGSGVAERLRAETAALVSVASGGDRRQAALDVDRLRSELDGLFASANPLLAPGLITQQLRASDQPLLSAADAFAARDFPTAYARLHEAARQVQKPAETLALAIVDRYPGRYLNLPAGRPATDSARMSLTPEATAAARQGRPGAPRPRR